MSKNSGTATNSSDYGRVSEWDSTPVFVPPTPPKCIYRTATHKELRTVDVQVDSYVLTLTKEEALTLMALFGRVGGDPLLSRRRHISALTAALQAVGLSNTYGGCESDILRGDFDFIL